MKVFEELLFRAFHDLESSKILSEAGINDIAIYHTQQCGEKSLKSFLAFREQELIPIHDLKKLNKECILLDENFIILEKYCVVLTPYAIAFRYVATDNIMPQKDETEEAIKFAEEIFNLVKSKIETV